MFPIQEPEEEEEEERQAAYFLSVIFFFKTSASNRNHPNPSHFPCPSQLRYEYFYWIYCGQSTSYFSYPRQYAVACNHTDAARHISTSSSSSSSSSSLFLPPPSFVLFPIQSLEQIPVSDRLLLSLLACVIIPLNLIVEYRPMDIAWGAPRWNDVNKFDDGLRAPLFFRVPVQVGRGNN